MELAITEMMMTEGDRVVMLRRTEVSGQDDKTAAFWTILDGSKRLGIFPDDDLEGAKIAAGTYLAAMVEVDQLRAKADATEASVRDKFFVLNQATAGGILQQAHDS